MTHTDEIFKEFNILTVHKLKLQKICRQMFNNANNALPEVIFELFISNTVYHACNTKNKQNLRPKVSKRAYMYKNFSFIGVQIWNDVQKHINISLLNKLISRFDIKLHIYLFY